MASIQCYKEEGKEFDYYEKSSGTYQKPTNYSNSGYQQSYYEKERCYETNPGMTGYGTSHGHQHGLGNLYGSTNPCGPMMGHGTGYGSGHNTHMQKPGFSGMGSGALGHVMGFGKKHEGHHGHGGYGMGAASGCTTTYKKQHRRRKGKSGYGSGSGSDCSDSSDDERRC
uniref:Keratin-associated protein 6-2 n=2 Tax=Nicotiana TaxID=4085 RepID=A0A1S3Z9C9_TOBAC|nr:PREDICTED: keratin-associated protein 6-2-like [Nicotiana sylvestris]XP_009759535.1 PREDICTED: keratin-associated protein 6-2-like [Nicotiana sylvestris]XP_016460973.1 PREDICTED: keratin-associated protein 6-2-like [Nicotiana tabacum]XP_016460974.1 PREDICTED: keratin-associated protein 6-2-like [Nicotiana tabacum]